MKHHQINFKPKEVIHWITRPSLSRSLEQFQSVLTLTNTIHKDMAIGLICKFVPEMPEIIFQEPMNFLPIGVVGIGELCEIILAIISVVDVNQLCQYFCEGD
jgi:hypothetical protein